MPEIATELSIGPETVKQHQKSARLKLGATTSAHAVALALANGTLRLDEVAPSGREGTILG
jgi:DNA-binding CsgD family transcriptional regulator